LNYENVIIPKEIRVPAEMWPNLKHLLFLREKTTLHHFNKPTCWCNQLWLKRASFSLLLFRWHYSQLRNLRLL